jgi:hypothetical protein
MSDTTSSIPAPLHIGLARKIIIFLTLVLLFVLGGVLLLEAELTEHNPLIKEVLTLLGSALVISVPVSYVYKLTFRPLDDEKHAADLKLLLDDKIDSLTKSRYVFRLGAIQECIDFPTVFRGLKKGQQLYWLDTWAPAFDAFQLNMEEALKKGADIRMLILDPSSKMCQLRAQEIGGAIGAGFLESQALFLKTMENMQQRTSTADGKLEIRTYDELLGIPCYIVCENDKPIHGWSSLYLGDATGVTFPHFFWEGGEGSVLDEIYKYVKEKWERNKPNAIRAAGSAQTVSA